jgi:hypothetical protein
LSDEKLAKVLAKSIEEQNHEDKVDNQYPIELLP